MKFGIFITAFFSLIRLAWTG